MIKSNSNGAHPRMLHIVGDSKFDGGSVVIYRLAQMAGRNGYVEVFTTHPVFQALLCENNIDVVDQDVIGSEINPVKDFAGLVRLWRFLKRNSYEIIHTHTSKTGFVGRRAAKLARVPAVVLTINVFLFHSISQPVYQQVSL